MEKNEPDTMKKAELMAIKYLSHKSRTEKEVYNKLVSCGEFDDGVVSSVIAMLTERGYINDARYAEFFIRTKAEHKLDGKLKIKQMLIQRGIDAKTADAAFLELEESGDVDASSNAEKLIRKKIGSTGKKFDYAQKKRLYGYLMRKGYSAADIFDAFKRIGVGTEDECDEYTDWD